MISPYLTIPFTLTEESHAWLNEFAAPLVKEYQENAPLDSGLIDKLSLGDQENISNSKAFDEIRAILAPLNLGEEPTIQFFIYKKLEKPYKSPLGNPHIDTYQGVDSIVPIRFNILLDGEDNQEMVWWNIHDMKNDPRLHVIQFPKPNDPTKFSTRCQARGETKEERWETVGKPLYSKNNLTKINKWASFVRTDILHSINWDGNKPRLILSLRFLSSWEKIEAFRVRVPELFPQLPALLAQSS